MLKIPSLWLGDERSYSAFLQRLEKFSPADGMIETRLDALKRNAHQKIGLLANPDEELSLEDELALELIEVYENVGLIKIEGSLVPEESYWNVWMGAVGYPSIARALNVLLEDESITDIVMAYATSGGSAEGVGDASDAIRGADRIKPVYAWTGSSMLSAGYWLGASARQVYATKVASVGSIGAVATFTSYARMRKERGLDTIIVRSAPLKAVPHPYETLSEKGKAVIQKDIDFFHGLFTDHVVASRLGLSSNDSKSTWATGESFFGEQALSLGLVDAPLRPLDSLLSTLIEAHTSQQQLSGGTPMPKRLVISSEASRASIMAGIPGQILEEEEVPTPGLQASGEPQEPAATEPTPEPVVTPEAAPAVAAEPTGTQLESVSDQAVRLLKETLAETKLLQESLIRLQIEHEKAVKDVTELQAMRPALEKSIQRLEVGLGHRPSLLDGLSVTALVGTYDQLYAELMKLPVGQHTLAAAEVPDTDLAQTIMQQRLTSIPGGKR